jgi:hypothetical protein
LPSPSPTTTPAATNRASWPRWANGRPRRCVDRARTPGLGARLADLFFRAGIQIVETGPIQTAEADLSARDWETEWAVIESDLAGFVPDADIRNMKRLDRQARERGERVLHVPTYFAWGKA